MEDLLRSSDANNAGRAELHQQAARPAAPKFLQALDDLTQRLDPSDPCAAEVNPFIDHLQAIWGSVIGQTIHVSQSAFLLDDQFLRLSHSVEVSRRESGEILGVIGHLHRDVENLSQGGQRVAESLAALASEAIEGRQGMIEFFDNFTEVAAQMQALYRFIADFEQAAGSVVMMVELVEHIMGQLRILGINAAIEAARLGPMGRGFAVVSDEIRRLSDQSGEAMRQVHTVVDQLKQNTRQLTREANGAVSRLEPMAQVETLLAERLHRILSGVQELQPTLEAVQGALKNQVAVIGHIHRAAGVLETEVSNAEGLVSVCHAAVQTVHQAVEVLVRTVGRFRTDWHNRLLACLRTAAQALSEGGVAPLDVLEKTLEATPYFELIYLMDAEGKQVTPNLVHPSRKGQVATAELGADRSDRPYFQVPVKDGRDYISPLYVSTATHELCLTLSVAVFNRRGQLTGVLAADVNVPTLMALQQPDANNLLPELPV